MTTDDHKIISSKHDQIKACPNFEADVAWAHLLVVPQAQAGEIRRAMFFLCTLALMGNEDQLMQAKGKGEVWARLGWWGRLDMQVSTSCRARVFLFF